MTIDEAYEIAVRELCKLSKRPFDEFDEAAGMLGNIADQLRETESEMNRKNLKKLADYLADLPEGGPRFDMTWYYTVPGDNNVFPSEIVESCKTAACAVGYATHIRGLEAYDDEHNWGTYIERIFGFYEGSESYTWCFHADWGDYDNTAKGASKRIKYFLKNGIPDEFFNENYISNKYVALYQ